jgi:proline iminopeptidase
MTLWIQNIWNGCLKEVQNGHFLLCPNGSHLAQYDDQKSILKGLYRFLRDVDKGTFKKGK